MISERRREIRWLKAALEDLAQIVEHIAADKPRAAEQFAESIFKKVELLATLPYLAPVCPYYRKARQMVHGNYVLYYTVHRKEIVIRAVVQGARLFRSSWMRREEPREGQP